MIPSETKSPPVEVSTKGYQLNRKYPQSTYIILKEIGNGKNIAKCNREWLQGSFSDNFYNSDGKDCNCVPLILQKNNKLKLQ